MAANPPLKPHKPFVSVLLLIVCLLGGILIGTAISEPLALAAGVGVLASWVVGIFVVAPRAGAIAKNNFIHALADPTEEDSELIELASAHIIGNMARMAQDEDMRKVYAPIFDAFMEQVNLNWEMSLKNLASQRERGVGVFNPENALGEAEMMQKLKADLMENFVEPLLGAAGFEGESLKNARNIMMLRMAGMSGGNSGLSSPSNFGGLQGGR